MAALPQPARQQAHCSKQLLLAALLRLCSGVDGLAHDPVAGSWGLTPRGYAAGAGEAAGWGLPLLVLGGGGYDDAAAARAWAAVLAALLGKVRAGGLGWGHAICEAASCPGLKPALTGPASPLRLPARPCWRPCPKPTLIRP